MSRIGKLPITLPKGVTCADDNLVSIKGPLGELNRQQRLKSMLISKKTKFLF